MISINRHAPAAAGFTLVEALVALLIFSWLSLASYQVLDQVILAQEVNQRKSEQLRQYQRVSWQMARDFRQLVNRTVRDTNGDVLSALDIGSGDYMIEFTRSGWQNPLQWPRSNLQRVAYSIDYHPDYLEVDSPYYNDEQLYLIRAYWQILDRVPESKPLEQVMIGGVVDFRIRIWDSAAGTWLDQSSFATTGRDYKMPEAIEISLVLESNDVITQIYQVL